MTPTTRYLKTFRRAIWLFLGGHLALAFALQLRGRVSNVEREVIPIFSWDLFSRVPNLHQDFALRLISVEGQALATPIYVERYLSEAGAGLSAAGAKSIERLGRAIERDRGEQIASYRALIETAVLGTLRTCKYEVVARSYDPLLRYQSGAFQREAVLSSWEKR